MPPEVPSFADRGIDPSEVDALKRLAAGIMNVQGNRFIKDLLRSKSIRIGNNKEEFKVNFEGAIDAGQITSDDVAPMAQ